MSAIEIKKNIGDFLNKEIELLGDDVELRSLVHDSFILIELVMRLQEDFVVRINQDDLVEVKTVGQLTEVILKKKSNS